MIAPWSRVVTAGCHTCIFTGSTIAIIRPRRGPSLLATCVLRVSVVSRPYHFLVRILRLTNSSDVVGSIPSEQRASAICDRIIEEVTGEPVETTVRVFWPAPQLPEIVDGWLQRYEPDVLFVRASAYWCSYESLPLLLERRLPLAGHWLARAGTRTGESRWAASRPFQVARRTLVRTFGGDVHFEPGEVSGILEQVFRRAARHESLVMALRGPGFPRDVTESARGARRARIRNDSLDHALAAMCERLHVAYAPHPQDFELGQLGADRFHTNEAGQRVQGEVEARLIARAWLAARIEL